MLWSMEMCFPAVSVISVNRQRGLASKVTNTEVLHPDIRVKLGDSLLAVAIFGLIFVRSD